MISARPFLCWRTCCQFNVAFDQAVLHLNCAAHRIHHAAKLDNAAVAGALDDAAMMRGYRGIDQVAAKTPQARERALLVGTGQSAVATTSATKIATSLRVSLIGAPCLRQPSVA